MQSSNLTSPLKIVLKGTALAALTLLPFAADPVPQIGVFFDQAEVAAADCGSYSCTLMGGSMSWQDAGNNYGFFSETYFEGDVSVCEEDASLISTEYLWTTGYDSSANSSFPNQSNSIADKVVDGAISGGAGALAGEGFDFIRDKAREQLTSKLLTANSLLPSTSFMQATNTLLGWSQTISGRLVGGVLGGI